MKEKTYTFDQLANRMADYRQMKGDLADKERAAAAKRAEMESFLRQADEQRELVQRCRVDIANMIKDLEPA